MSSAVWPVHKNGGELQKGYKPDRVYKRGSQWVIVEIEAHTSRKGFIGGAVKAAMYFDKESIERGKFVYIVSQRNFKNLDALKGQMEPVLDWLEDWGINTPPTYIVHDTNVRTLKKEGYTFPSVGFFRRCIEV
jgi:hypothetical protein